MRYYIFHKIYAIKYYRVLYIQGKYSWINNQSKNSLPPHLDAVYNNFLIKFRNWNYFLHDF